MNKLTLLRTHLLEGPYGLKPDQLATFVESGSVQFYDGETNDNFALIYQAKVGVMDFSQNPLILQHALVTWMKQHQTAHEFEAFTFEAEILDTSKVDILITLTLTEDVLVLEDETGIHIDIAPEIDTSADDYSGMSENANEPT
ncbi:MAG: phage tail protein [Parvibaculaceae bacterium]|nr:phage tail protein [Parvibaculaceae bacterium]